MNQLQTGKFMAELRKEQGMTQVELGEKVGVTNKTISRWENGNYMPDISVLPILSEVLDISVNELLSGQRLSETAFKQSADHHLILSLQQVKAIKRRKSLTSFFTGSGTGLLLSCLGQPDSTNRTITILLGLVLLCIGWFRERIDDRMIFRQIEDEN